MLWAKPLKNNPDAIKKELALFVNFKVVESDNPNPIVIDSRGDTYRLEEARFVKLNAIKK